MSEDSDCCGCPVTVTHTNTEELYVTAVAVLWPLHIQIQKNFMWLPVAVLWPLHIQIQKNFMWLLWLSCDRYTYKYRTLCDRCGRPVAVTNTNTDELYDSFKIALMKTYLLGSLEYDDFQKSRVLYSVSAYYYYTGPCLGVQRRVGTLFVGGTVSTWGRWRTPVNKRQTKHQKCRSSTHCSWGTCRSDSRFHQLVV